jgi:3-dehydroquinate dehydratase / shikimate dehydrogenase
VTSTTTICVPLCEKDLNALHHASNLAIQWSNFIEVRLDCLENPQAISQLLPKLPRPLILTFRPSEQGGYRILTHEDRVDFWSSQSPYPGIWWDIEADLSNDLSPDWSRTIVSHHDFSGIPIDLEQIYERLAQTPAQVVKIAVEANDVTDCLPIFKLLDRARLEDKELIAIAMGNAGLATRILGPSRGSFLTYAALDDDRGTAPGQVNAHKLRLLYNIDNITTETMICGLVGLPVMHSVSPHIHNAAFTAEKLNGVYLPFEVRDVRTFFKRMVHPRTRELDWNLRGLSITAPHKQTVMECLDWISPEAKEISAVNTVVVEDHRLLGYNTDAAGLLEPLLKLVGPLANKNVAIIGAGGAARAALWALQREGATVTTFVRDVNKANIPCEPLNDASFSGFSLVINATPLGSGEHIDETPATTEQLSGAGCIYDLVYNPLETRFMREARNAGCETLGGLDMLVSQAKLQFELWTGIKTIDLHGLTQICRSVLSV